MRLQDALQIPRGLTAVIGGGGKSTLLLCLGRELARKPGNRVLLCTSTHMFPPQGVPLACTLSEAQQLLKQEPLIALGAWAAQGKLTQAAPMEETLRLATHVLCEADGAKGLPLKAHASYEPVVPRETNRLIYVAGADGLGQTIAQAAHRPQLYAALLGAAQTHVVTPQEAVQAILAEGFDPASICLLVNKAEGVRRQPASQMAAAWPGRGIMASLESQAPVLEVWERGQKLPDG